MCLHWKILPKWKPNSTDVYLTSRKIKNSGHLFIWTARVSSYKVTIVVTYFEITPPVRISRARIYFPAHFPARIDPTECLSSRFGFPGKIGQYLSAGFGKNHKVTLRICVNFSKRCVGRMKNFRVAEPKYFLYFTLMARRFETGKRSSSHFQFGNDFRLVPVSKRTWCCPSDDWVVRFSIYSTSTQIRYIHWIW